MIFYDIISFGTIIRFYPSIERFPQPFVQPFSPQIFHARSHPGSCLKMLLDLYILNRQYLLKSDPWPRYAPPPYIYMLDWYNRKGRKCSRNEDTAPCDHWEWRSRAKKLGPFSSSARLKMPLYFLKLKNILELCLKYLHIKIWILRNNS